MKKYIYFLILSYFIISCEPDDICLTSIPDTPRLIIGFFDESSGSKKEINDLKIQGLDNNEFYFYETTDSISIPLKNLEKLTNYLFTKNFDENTGTNGNDDHILINYQYNHIFVSRACGYVSNYDLNQIIIESDDLNWIIKTKIINSEVKDEKAVHVKIFH